MPERTLVQAVRDALFEEMARDPRVCVLGEDVGRKGGVFKATEGLQKQFGPERVLDTPLADSSIAGVAQLPRAEAALPGRPGGDGGGAGGPPAPGSGRGARAGRTVDR